MKMPMMSEDSVLFHTYENADNELSQCFVSQGLQGCKDIYLPVTLNSIREFVLVTFRLYINK